jgi:hypothetical protein
MADCIDDMVRALSAERMVDWLIQSHGLKPTSRDTVLINLREQFRWHRLQGRLDHAPSIAVLAEVWGLRQSTKAIAPKNNG